MTHAAYPIGNPELSHKRPLLLIGNKNYSSWSLRGWLALHAFGIDFEEHQIVLFSPAEKSVLETYSPTGKVPVLIHGAHTVWDSLAIALYAGRELTDQPAWGPEPGLAQSLACEMHSGFPAIRNELSMNLRAQRKIIPSAACLQELQRVDDLFCAVRARYGKGGDYLFGAFTMTDVAFAPLAFRFATYLAASGLTLSETAQSYCDALLAHPSMQAWAASAALETDIVVEDEVGEPV